MPQRITRIVKTLARSVLAALCLCCLGAPSAVLAEAPMVKTQAPGFYRVMLGDFELTVLSDGTNLLPATTLLMGDPTRVAASLKRDFLGEQVETSHNSFLINTGSKLVLIDAGAGSMLGPRPGDLIANLRAAGYRPEQVDEIYLTHMHTDHVGGLVAAGRQRAFPNAVVRTDRREMDYWLSEPNLRAAPEAAKRFFRDATAAVTPYLEAGMLKVFDGDTALVPGVHPRAIYGHTPGHTAYVVESRGQRLVLWGDVVHVAAVQFGDPSVTIGYDLDDAQAGREHVREFAEAAKSGDLIGGAHIAFPGLGHVRRDGKKAYVFVPLNYTSLN